MEDTSKQEILEAVKANNTRIDEVLEAVNNFASATEERFNQIDQKFGQIDQKFGQIDQKFGQIDQKFGQINQRLDRIESTMVTKDFLEDQLAILKGDLVIMLRGEDKKIIALVEIMEKKQMLTRDEARVFYEMEPFPKLII